MDTFSASEAARRLGTSLPRVRRAIDRLGLDIEQRSGGRVLLSEAQLEQLRSELGVVPVVDGLSRVETQVLAALARAPRGLATARAVARRAGVSPTAASAALRSLAGRGLVRREREWVAAGRAREVELVRANVSAPEWASLAPRLATVRPPARREHLRPRRLPSRLRHLFWNADTARLDLDAHGAYIAERLLSSHDLDGLAWGARALTSADWQRAARNRGLTAQERALAQNLARVARG
jgi:DNA-binding transcriptional ArsR family regulator